MDTKLINNYVLKAMDAYPYELEETVENLNYAMSYDPKNEHALHLMGKLQSEQFKNYESAKDYFEQALAINMDNKQVYEDYLLTLIENEDYPEAKRLLKFALKIKGIKKDEIMRLKGLMQERQGKFKKALRTLTVSINYAYDSHCIAILENDIARLRKKLKIEKRRSSKKKKRRRK